MPCLGRRRPELKSPDPHLERYPPGVRLNAAQGLLTGYEMTF